MGEIGCSQYQLTWKELFLNGFDLRKNGTHSYYVKGFQSCKVIHGSPMYYDSLDKRWKQICSEIFTVRFNIDKGIILEVSYFHSRHFILGYVLSFLKNK